MLARRRTLSGKTLGALAVVGVVIAFSLSSTLVKRAESPASSSRSGGWPWSAWSGTPTCGAPADGSRSRHVRQALVPGVFFGLNLATFFAGATHNSVANAALIGSLSPFLIVPLGAMALPRVHRPAGAGVRARGVRRRRPRPVQRAAQRRRVAAGQRLRRCWRCCSGPATSCRPGTSAGTWTSPRSWRRSARSLPWRCCRSPSPTATCSGLSGTGWTYTLLLTFLTGVAAHGLMVFAQRTIQIGTIGIAQVVQPALAVVWSFLLLGETLRQWQVRRHRHRHGRAARVPGR